MAKNSLNDNKHIPENQEFIPRKEKNQTKKEVKDILEAVPCPFPEHEGYAKVWKKLKPEEQQQMKENFRISTDGKVESIKLHKKFSMLEATPNGKDILDENYKDVNWESPRDKGISWAKYFTREAAARECKKQEKMFLKNEMELKQFIDSFPGKRLPAKINNLVNLLGLKKTSRLTISNVWYSVGSAGEVALSEISGGNYNTINFSDLDKYISGFGGKEYLPFLVCEDC